MKNTSLKLNIVRLSLFLSAVFFIWHSPVAYAKEINSHNILELINSSRVQSNLNPLILNPTLSKVAQSKATDMIKNHYFSHTSPAGVTPWHWFDKNNYPYKYAGENLAINYDDAEEEHTAWMKSSAHRKNILNSNFNEIGIATSKGTIEGKKSNITVTVFGRQAESILATNARSSLSSRNTYILGTQSTRTQNVKSLTAKSSIYQLDADNKFFELLKKQSNNIFWTVALIAILIVLKDIVLKTIHTKTFHHRHSVINLLLFLMIYAILF